LEVDRMLRLLATGERRRLIAAMHAIEQLLDGRGKESGAVRLRPHRPGDMGWIVSRHGALYAQEYGWGERLEALCAEIAAAFLRNFDADRERCWVAERDEEPLGTVMLVKETAQVARLRLLLVEPKARGLGVGMQLVEECIGFAREAGYRKITLW